MATLVTYPCQNLRARAQAGELAGKNATNFLGVLQNEGLRGLYRGLIPTLVHVTPNVCIVFLVSPDPPWIKASISKEFLCVSLLFLGLNSIQF